MTQGEVNLNRVGDEGTPEKQNNNPLSPRKKSDSATIPFNKNNSFVIITIYIIQTSNFKPIKEKYIKMINLNLKMTPFIWILVCLNLLFGLSDLKHTKAEIWQQESIPVTPEGAKKLTQQLIRSSDQNFKIIEQILKENIPISISIQWQGNPTVSLDEPNGRYKIYYPSLLVTVEGEEVTIPFDAISVTATPRIDGHYLIEMRLPSEISFSTDLKMTIGEQNYKQLWNPIQNTSELEAVFTDVNFISRQNTVSLSQIIITAEEITDPQKTKENDLNAYLSIILENTRSPIGQIDYIEIFTEEELKEGVSIFSSMGLNIFGLESHEAGLFKFDMFSTFFSLEELERSLSNLSFSYYHKGLNFDSLPVVFESLYPINLLFDLTVDNIPSEILSNFDKWIENSLGPYELLFNLFNPQNALSKLQITLYQGDIASSALTVSLSGRYDPSPADDNAPGYLDIVVTGIDDMLRILGEELQELNPNNEVKELFIFFNILKTLGTTSEGSEDVPIYHYRLEMTQDGLTLNGINLSDLGF